VTDCGSTETCGMKAKLFKNGVNSSDGDFLLYAKGISKQEGN